MASASSASTSAESAQAVALVVGEQTATAVNITFNNETGAPLTNIAMLPAGSADEPALLMAEGQQVANGESVQVYTEPNEGLLYDVVVMAGEAQYRLHDVNLNLYTQAAIALEGDIAYLRVTIDGNEASSLQDESARAQAEAAAAAAEPYTTEYADTYYEEPSYDDSYYYEEPAATAEAPAQDEDSCVSDVVLR